MRAWRTRWVWCLVFFFQAEDGIRDLTVTGVQTCALPIYSLKTSAEYAANAIGPPHHLVVSTLHAALAGGDLYRWLLNSLLITAASVLKIGRASCRERV